MKTDAELRQTIADCRTCRRCGKAILSRYSRVRFCSPACWYASQRERSDKPCAVCGKVFHPLWFRTKTCSQACGGVLRRKRLPIKCQICGKDFWRHASAPNRKVCSKKCGWQLISRQVPVKCAQCGKVFTRSQVIAKRGKNTFCNSKCFWKFQRGPKAPNFRGGNNHFRGPDWTQQARRARRRDRDVCRVCSRPKQKGEQLSVDHIIPYRVFPSNDLRNLLSVCRAPCHAKKTMTAEAKFLRGDKLGFLADLNQQGWPMDAVQVALELWGKSPQIEMNYKAEDPRKLEGANEGMPILP